MLHGSNMYGILMVLELGLGPLMSLVIFNPKKSKRHLFIDYSIVVAVQISALLYGLYSVSISRPVFLVFVKDRIEVISAVELLEMDVKEAGRDAEIGWLGPKRVCVEFPVDPKEKSDLLISALNGRDIQLFPKYYRQCQEGEILSKSFSKERLFLMTKIKLSDLPKNLVEKDFTWLPMVTRFGAWLVIYEKGKKERYLDLNPFDLSEG